MCLSCRLENVSIEKSGLDVNFRKRGVLLLITHKLSAENKAELDVC